MPTSVEQLDQARAEVPAATGPDFLRRLADYCYLLEDAQTISAAVQQLRDEVAEAEARLTQEDANFVAELVPIRRELVEREPEIDDSNIERHERFDPANRVWPVAVVEVGLGSGVANQYQDSPSSPLPGSPPINQDLLASRSPSSPAWPTSNMRPSSPMECDCTASLLTNSASTR